MITFYIITTLAIVAAVYMFSLIVGEKGVATAPRRSREPIHVARLMEWEGGDLTKADVRKWAVSEGKEASYSGRNRLWYIKDRDGVVVRARF